MLSRGWCAGGQDSEEEREHQHHARCERGGGAAGAAQDAGGHRHERPRKRRPQEPPRRLPAGALPCLNTPASLLFRLSSRLLLVAPSATDQTRLFPCVCLAQYRCCVSSMLVLCPLCTLVSACAHGAVVRYSRSPCSAQVDTKDILFICGGAFIGLDRQVAERTAMSSIGFGNPVRWVPSHAPPRCHSIL